MAIPNLINKVYSLFNYALCVGDCDVTISGGTLIQVTTITTGIDFSLDIGGQISGKVTNAAGGAGINQASVRIYNSAGKFVGRMFSDSNGNYITSGLVGIYYLRTENFAGFIDELFNDLPCTLGSCDQTVTSGTPVTVNGNVVTTGRNFALLAGGRIGGTVTNASGGGGIESVLVQIYDAAGSFVGSATTDASGNYTTSGMQAGTYYMRSLNSQGFVDELYDNIPCPLDSCNQTVTSGTQIVVNVGATATKNFVLAAGGRISGTVTNANGGAAIPNVSAWIFNAAGTFLGSTNTNASGTYTTNGLPTGMYFVRTANSLGFIDQLFNGIPCPSGACTITSGTGISVTSPATASPISFVLENLPGAPPRQVTADAGAESWSARTSSTSQGTVLWTADVNSDGIFDDVLFFDGTSVSTIQPRGILTAVNDANAFALGSGTSPGDVVGLWRRDTDFAWVWTRNAAGTTTGPALVTATNPINAANPMNPEAVAIADGCVFLVLQPQANVKHVFRVDPTNGNGTLLTNGLPVPGAPRVTTSGCKAAWTFDDGTTKKLQFYDGSTVSSQLDSGDLGNPYMSHGKIVYAKTVGGIQQIFLYDTTQASPSPVQLSFDSTGVNDLPRTDGRHVAWVHGEPSGTPTAWNVVFNGGLTLTSDAGTRPQININEDVSFQLQRGQLLWKDTAGTPRYYAGGRLSFIDILPATSFERFWLADGFAAFLGTGGADAGTDKEIFRFTGTPPTDTTSPMFVSASPGASQATVSWDRVAGATSYNLYMAQQPGVTKDNYLTLTGGTKFTAVNTPFTVTGLNPHGTYHFVVTAVDGAAEGPSSPEAHASLTGNLTWTSASGLPAVAFFAVTADRVNAAIAYAAAGSGALGVYKTTNSGANWSPLAGGIQTRDIRALAANGLNVYAATKDGDILRSTNGGGAWSVVADGSDIGEQNKALIIDPLTPATLYAGDFQLPSKGLTDSFIIRSMDGGANWVHRPEATDPSFAEMRAYVLAVDPVAGGGLYQSGTGTPNLGRSHDGGTTWKAIQPSGGFVYAMAADSRQATSLYAGMMNVAQTNSLGLFKSLNEGGSWSSKNTGLPGTLPRINVLLPDPANPSYLHIGTDSGYFFSIDAAETWTVANSGLSSPTINALAVTGSRRLLAATSAGVFVLDLSVPALAPSISTQPQSQAITSGQSAMLSVGATGTATITYQWYVGTSGTTTNPIGGAMSSNYTTPALTSTTSYWVRVSNNVGTADSNTSTITVTNPSGFTDDPLIAGSSAIKAVHITELRTRIDALRARYALGPYQVPQPPRSQRERRRSGRWISPTCGWPCRRSMRTCRRR